MNPWLGNVVSSLYSAPKYQSGPEETLPFPVYEGRAQEAGTAETSSLLQGQPASSASAPGTLRGGDCDPVTNPVRPGWPKGSCRNLVFMQ